MSAKTSAARQTAFLKALGETGNITVSAERAKVSRSWVLLHRARDAEFEAGCREALAGAKARLGEHGARRPPTGWGHLAGEELVVKGTGGAHAGRRVQIARARTRQWTPRAENRFLAALYGTCNVKAACAEVGLTQASAYAHRKRWRSFARRWDETVDEAMTRIELALLQEAGNPFSGQRAPSGLPIREITASEAIYMLEMHKRRVNREGSAPGRRPRPRPLTLDDVRQGILNKLGLIERLRWLEEGAREEKGKAGGEGVAAG